MAMIPVYDDDLAKLLQKIYIQQQAKDSFWDAAGAIAAVVSTAGDLIGGISEAEADKTPQPFRINVKIANRSEGLLILPDSEVTSPKKPFGVEAEDQITKGSPGIINPSTHLGPGAACDASFVSWDVYRPATVCLTLRIYSDSTNACLKMTFGSKDDSLAQLDNEKPMKMRWKEGDDRKGALACGYILDSVPALVVTDQYVPFWPPIEVTVLRTKLKFEDDRVETFTGVYLYDLPPSVSSQM